MSLIALSTLLLILGIGIGYLIFRFQSRRESITSAESLYRTIVETAQEDVWLLDAEARITFANLHLVNLLGYNIQELVGHPATDIIDSEHRHFAEHRLRLLKDGVSQRFDLLLRHKDGSSRWVCVSTTPQYDANHQFVGTSGILFDISERKRAEDALQESEERYRIVSESTFDALVMHDNGTVIQANKAAVKLFGYELEEMIGHNVKKLLVDADSLAVADQAIATGFEGIYELTLRRKDGTTFFAEIHGRNVNYHGHRVRIASYHDMSERKKAADSLRDINIELERRVQERTLELQRQQMELNVILNAVGEGVFYSEGQFIRVVNPALLRITGYDPEDLIGKRGGVLLDRKLTLLDTSPDPVVAMREHALKNPNKLWRGEMVLMRKDGSVFNAALTFTALTDANNAIIGSVVVIRDITEEKRLEARKAAFVANASHELRTPLTNIRTRLYLLRKQPQAIEQHLQVLEKVAERMQNLVADLLDVSRFERGVISVHRRDISLQELIQEVIETQQPEAQQKDITLISQLPPEIVEVSADPDRLLQVIVNLTVNAINYTPVGGRVSVELTTETSKIAVLRVEDSGVGIDPEHLAHIFEPFFRVHDSKTPGTGLGLSISKSIVELHGGTLEVESTLQVGSTFIVRLPLSETVRV